VGERVEGYSNFLWILVVAPFMKLGANPLWVAKLLGLLFGAASLVLIDGTAFLLFEEDRAGWIGLMASVLAGCSWYFALWSIGGLESTLFAFLLIATVCSYARYRRRAESDPSAHDWSWLPLALLGMTRPEGPLVFVVLLAVKLYDLRMKRGQPRQAILWLGGFVAIYATYFLWRWSYFGELLPNTYYAKTSGGAIQYRIGAMYLIDFLTTQGLVYASLGFVGLAGALACVMRTRNSLFAVLLLIGLAYAFFIVDAGGDWMPGFRFVVHVYPIVALVIAAGLYEVVRLPSVAGAALIVMTASSLFASAAHLKQPDQVPWLGDRLGDRIDLTPTGPYDEMAQYLKRETSARSWVALGEAGFIPYVAEDINVIDIFGLMDKHIGRLPGLIHEKGDAAYVLSRQPDYILLIAQEDKAGVIRYPWPPMRQFLEQKLFQTEYRLQKKVARNIISADVTENFYLYARDRTLTTSK
jgi:hypothetical protein